MSRIGTAGLSLSGLRVGPIDPKDKTAQINIKPQYALYDPTSNYVPTFVGKERSGFSGGFKISLEQRKARLGRKIRHDEGGEDEDAEEGSKNEITKEEVMAQLNLGSSQSAAGMGKHGTGSKAALTKDLIENLEKELDKLKRNEEGIKLRKRVALKGDRGSFDETEEDRQRARDAAVEDEMKALGNNVIHAGEKRIQVVRHRVGQLDSVKALPYEELEAMRLETAARLAVLEEQYWGKKDRSAVSQFIKDKYHKSQNSNQLSTMDTPEHNKGDLLDRNDKDNRGGKSKKRDRSNKKNGILKNTNANRNGLSTGSLAKPRNTLQSSAGHSTAASGGRKGRRDTRGVDFDDSDLQESRPKFGAALARASRSRSKSAKPRSPSPPSYNDPRQQIYEAKYEKYLANKTALRDHDVKRHSMKKDGFDLYTKMKGSPSKHANRTLPRPDPILAQLSGKYHPDDLGTFKSADQEEELRRVQLARTDPFGALGVGAADKMTFFLLKWVFNAIKRESSEDDVKFKGQNYVAKTDLVKQLAKNPELLRALGYEDHRQLHDVLKVAAGRKEGYLTWGEFLDFFFLGDASLRDKIDGNDWWNQLDSKGNYAPKSKVTESDQKEDEKADKIAADGSLALTSPDAAGRRLPLRKDIKVTDSIKMLQESRAERATREVEEEFARIAADQKAKQGQPAPQEKKKTAGFEGLEGPALGGDGYGFGREKSKSLLLSSQVAVMEEVFKKHDKYDEGILRRSDFVMALRTEPGVIDFIDCEAVNKPYSNIVLTLDAILLEIEKDERYDESNQARDSINHKEFLTWREFLTYFHDYQDIEARNRKQSGVSKAQKSIASKTGEDEHADGAGEMKTLMEQEKERRLEELPKLREADQIDISEKQLRLIKDIFDTVPRVGASKDAVNVLSFFLTTRKDPQIRLINTTVARDPSGCSRIPKETFQEVFDRMERELQQKQVDWATVVEFFTKRGRPLSKDEILKLVEEDRREREQTLAKKRADEEAERRRNQRIMGDLEEEEDYEAFELRQKADRQPDQDSLLDPDDIEKKYARSNSQDEEDQGSYGDSDEEWEEDDLERDRGDNDLTKTTLRNSDYVARGEAANAKKGRYGVTVPTPFGFDTRDARRSKTIREQKVDEMVREKKLEEDACVRYQFRSKPIPPEVLIPKYQTILEADLARRQNVRSQSIAITAKREAPFTFWEREKASQTRKKTQIEDRAKQGGQAVGFKANPIPRACSVLIFDKKMKQEELIRGKRIRKNAEIAFAKARMPPTMQKHADRKKQEPPKRLDVEYSFKPDIGPRVTAKQLEDQAQRFQRELAKKKGQKTQTIPRSPDFAKRPPKILDRDHMNEGQSSKQEDKYTAQMRKLAQSVKSLEGTVQTNPSSTKAAALSQQKRRQDIQEKRKREEATKKEDEDRIKKQNSQKERVQSALKAKFGKSASQVIAEAAKEKKDDQRKQERQTRERLQEAINKGRTRPMLYEQNADSYKNQSNLAMLKATQKMVNILKSQGHDPNFFLSEDQKEVLEKEDITNELRKKYQK